MTIKKEEGKNETESVSAILIFAAAVFLGLFAVVEILPNLIK